MLTTAPSRVVSELAGTPSFLAPRSINTFLASAQAWRRPARKLVLIDWLPDVVPWSGVNHVSDSSRSMLLSGTSSSSAAICICAVRRPVPSSTLPTCTRTRPSCPTTTHESTCVASISAGPIAAVAARARVAPAPSGTVNATISAPLPLRKSRREWGFSIMLVISPPSYAVACAARLTALTIR